MPIFLGVDHTISARTILEIARRASESGRWHRQWKPEWHSRRLLYRATNLCMIGIKSVDPVERSLAIIIHDIPTIDEHGVASVTHQFFECVQAVNGKLDVSFDVNFLNLDIGTTVPVGATFLEAYLIIEMFDDSGLVSNLDFVELNPFLDERGKTTLLIVNLVASLTGRRVMD